MRAKNTVTNKDGKEPKYLAELRRCDPSEVQEERDRVQNEQLRQAQEKAERAQARAAEMAALRARRKELGVELGAARPALTNAKLRLAEARAKGEGDLDALRAKVADCKREIEELEAAIDIVDADLARLNRGTQYGKYKVV